MHDSTPAAVGISVHCREEALRQHLEELIGVLRYESMKRGGERTMSGR